MNFSKQSGKTSDELMMMINEQLFRQFLPSVVVDEEIFVVAEITDGIDDEVNGETIRGGGVGTKIV